MSTETSRDIQIIPIAEEYIESYHQCLDSVARERLYLAFVEAPPLPATQEFVRANIVNHFPQWVAIYGKEVVGWCDILPMQGERFTHCGRLGMGVRWDYRRQGIGQQLLVETVRCAKEKGVERIELEVFASNTAAIKLYERAGFAGEGVKRRAYKINGKYQDILEMALFI